jgi:hypothetical protein
MGKHFIDHKSSEILSIFQVFPCTLRSLDIPALLKSRQKHYCNVHSIFYSAH